MNQSITQLTVEQGSGSTYRKTVPFLYFLVGTTIVVPTPLYISIAWGAVKSPQNQAAFQTKTKPISPPCGAQTAQLAEFPGDTTVYPLALRLAYQALAQKGGT